MGVQITELIPKKEITYSDLRGKVLAVDAFNQLYMFLTTIRQRDGTSLTDSKGNVTSHLVGVFSRFSKLLTYGIKFIFVFDGKTPKLKEKERDRRRALKEEALVKYEAAKKKEDLDEMKKYASRTTVLTSDMVKEAKELIKAMGMPIVEAPSEGEAQAAKIVKDGNAFAVMSQDADSLLFGSSKVVKNLSIGNRRKKPGSFASNIISPELITLDHALQNLELSREKLIALAMLVGTDYNIGGIKGLGPKKALKKVTDFSGDNFEELFKSVEWDKHFDYSWKEVFDLFVNCETIDDYKLDWSSPSSSEINKVLVENHDFSKDRVSETLNSLKKSAGSQKGLNEFF